MLQFVSHTFGQSFRLVDVAAMACFEGGCLVVVHAVLSVDDWELITIEKDGCWRAEGLVHFKGFSCFTEEVCLSLEASGD